MPSIQDTDISILNKSRTNSRTNIKQINMQNKVSIFLLSGITILATTFTIKAATRNKGQILLIPNGIEIERKEQEKYTKNKETIIIINLISLFLYSSVLTILSFFSSKKRLPHLGHTLEPGNICSPQLPQKLFIKSFLLDLLKELSITPSPTISNIH